MRAKTALLIVFAVIVLCIPMQVQAAPRVQFSQDLPASGASYDGETWRIIWSGSAIGYSDIGEPSGIRTVTSHSATMVGATIIRFDDDLGWETEQWKWSVTDDFDQEVTTPCTFGGQSKVNRNETILDSERPPVWDYMHILGVFTNPDGTPYLRLELMESIAGPPSFSYQYTHRYDSCGNDPPTTSKTIADKGSYARVFFRTDDLDWNLGPRLACNSQVTNCWVHKEFTTDYKHAPLQISVSIFAYRLPDSPSIQQGLELREESVFLPGVPLTARVDGQLACDRASACSATRIVQLPNGASTREAIGPAPTGNYPKYLQIGDLPPGRTTIVAQADSPTAAPPDSKLAQIAAKIPGWAGGVAAIIARKVGDYASYTWEAKFPEPPIKKEWPIPDGVPFVGGKKAGVELPQSGLKTEAKSTGEVSLEGSVGGALLLGDSAIGINLAGRGNGVLDMEGVRDIQGEVDVKVYGKVSAEEPLVKAIPPMRPTIALIDQFSPAVARFLENRAKAVLEIEPSWTSTFQLSDKSGKIDIDQAVIAPAIAIKVKAILKMFEDMLEAGIGVGGDVKAVFPTPPLSLKEIGLNFVVTIEGVVLHFGFTKSAGFSCVFPPATCTTTGGMTAAQFDAPTWSVIDRTYLAAADYGQWRGDLATAAAATAGPIDVELVANVFPQANPALALGNSRRLLVWSHDQPGTPALSGQELAWSTSSGSGQPWQPAAAATADDRADFNREVAFVSSSQAVAVWQRFDTATPGDLNVDPHAYLSHVQVAASTWNGSSWRAPQQLSNGGSMNSRPRVGAISGGALAAWIGNAGNQLIGDAVRPDTIYYARYSAGSSSWSAAGVAVAAIPGLMEMQLATSGSQAALVYVQDQDGDFATFADHELFYMLWTGNGWAAAVRLTNNNVVDEAPRVVLDGTGVPFLVWTQDGRLKFLRGSWDAAQAVDLTLPAAVGASDLRLVRGANGSLALAWQQPDAVDTRIGYAIYSPAPGLWSMGTTHTPPISGTVAGPTTLATHISSALENNRLLLAYQLATVEPVTVTVDGLVIPNAPHTVRHSLRYAEVPLTLNLAISPADIRVTPLDAQPGQPLTITARIHNTGQLSAPAVQAELRRDVYPNLLAVSAVGPLAGGASGVVSFNITQPITEASQLTVRVTPSPIYESTLADNEAPVITPPLVTALSSRYTVLGPQVAATFQQQGVLQGGHAFTVSLRLDDAYGPEVGTTVVAYADNTIQQIVTATATLSPTQLGPGRHLAYWVLEKDYTNPQDVDGASAVSGASVAADLTVDAADVATGMQRSASSTVEVLVTNRGAWPSTPSAIAAYDRNPALPGATKLNEAPIPALAPGTTAGIIVNLAAVDAAAIAASEAVYLEIDPAHNLQELNRGNNLTAIGQIAIASDTGNRVFLPLVVR